MRQFRRIVGALAILGAFLNAWVLTLHITSAALIKLHAIGGIAICHHGDIKYVFFPDAGEKPVSKKGCPVCSGLANLDAGTVSEPSLYVAPPASVCLRSEYLSHDLVVDHRPRQTLNRGPPLQV